MNKEYIEREAALNELKEELEMYTPMFTKEQNHYIDWGLRIAVKDIKNLPAVDVVEVKHGKWLIVDDIVDKNLCNLVCSVCGRREYNIENPKKAIEYRPYCHCGAKMDGN